MIDLMYTHAPEACFNLIVNVNYVYSVLYRLL